MKFIVAVFSFCTAFSSQPLFMQRPAPNIEETINSMSLRDKIAQMMMIRVGLISTEQERKHAHELVEKYHVGGIFLATTPKLGQGADQEMRQTNCTMAKAKELVDSLQAASGHTLLVGMDCEWGTAMRLVDGIQIPYNMALAGIEDVEKLRRVGAIVGHQSMQLGVHCLGVVVDVNSNPENPVIGVRSFGSDPATVSRCALAMIQGMQEAGCIVAAKHFCGHQDGHGNTKDDSHCMLPLVNDERIAPALTFQEAIDAGVDAIMTAHVDVRCLTKVEREEQNKSELSATMSHAIITEVLKKQMNFRGLVMTDALDMLGVATYYSPCEAAAQALIAGNDILLFPLDVPACIDYIEQQVIDGTIDVALIDCAVTKILQAKAHLQILRYSLRPTQDERSREFCEHIYPSSPLTNYPQPFVLSSAQRVSKDAQEFVRQLYRDTIAVAGDVSTAKQTIATLRRGHADYSFLGQVPEYLKKQLSSTTPQEQQKDHVATHVYIVGLPPRGKLSADAKELLQKVREQMINNPGSLAVVLGNPYAAYELTQAGPVLLGFDIHPLAQQAVLDILHGREMPTAVFPIRK